MQLSSITIAAARVEMERGRRPSAAAEEPLSLANKAIFVFEEEGRTTKVIAGLVNHQLTSEGGDEYKFSL